MKEIKLAHWCVFMAIITALVGVSQFLGIINGSYELGKDESEELKYQFLVEGIHAWAIIACCVLFFWLANNAKKGEIFVLKNESLLMIFGVLFFGLA